MELKDKLVNKLYGLDRIQWLLVLAVFILCVTIGIKDTTFAILSGIYQVTALISLMYFRRSYSLAVIMAICSQVTLVIADLIRGNVGNFGLNIFNISILLLAIYLNNRNKLKSKSSNKEILSLSKFNRSQRVILVSIIILTALSISRSSGQSMTILTAILVILLAMLEILTIALRVEELYFVIIAKSLISLYVCYMEWAAGGNPILFVITNTVVLAIAINEYLIVEKERAELNSKSR